MGFDSFFVENDFVVICGIIIFEEIREDVRDAAGIYR